MITADTIEFMRKLDVKEIHGYHAARGLRILRPDACAAASAAQATSDKLQEETRHVALAG